ncbi:hypothetical protein S245_018878, partial [Arachis hypogaea]
KERNSELAIIVAEHYHVTRLKGKYNLDYTLHIMKRNYMNFKKNEFMYDYDILKIIFNSNTAAQPPNSYEEKQIEDDFLLKGVYVSDVIDVDKDNVNNVSNKKKQKGSSSESRPKEAKNSILIILEDALKSSKAKIDLLKAKVERYKLQVSQAISPLYDPYSIDACMELLDYIEDISNKVYNKTLEKFKDEDWRCMFIKIFLFRRKDWLASLEFIMSDKKDVFKKFCDALKDTEILKNDKKVSVEEGVAIKIIRLTNQTTTHLNIMENSRFFSYFK